MVTFDALKQAIKIIQYWINSKFQIATDEDIIDSLLEIDMLRAVGDKDGAIITDENGNILLI